MRINYNVSAMISNNALANNDALLAKSLQRLSSGLKINQAKDGPAGLAMAKRMNAQIEGINVAGANASDGVSVLEIADGALSEIHEMLHRMTELAVKGSNGTMTDDDRAVINDEVKQLKDEITRISESTEFNGQKLLNGEFAAKGYTDQDEIKVNSYSGEVTEGDYEILSLPIERDPETGDIRLNGTATLGEGFPSGARVTAHDEMIEISADNGFQMTLDVSAYKNYDGGAFNINVLGAGAMRLQIGANEGQILEMDIPEVNLKNLGIDKLDLSTVDGAKKAITDIEYGVKKLSEYRGRLGAYQNRLESTVNSLDVTDENMTAAYSRIMDVDMAEEMTRYTTAQVLTQAGTSMLAQANERPSQVLQLLQ